MAVITDVGNENDVHPRQKEPVGARLALAARSIAYGEPIVGSGPEYARMDVKGDRGHPPVQERRPGARRQGRPAQGLRHRRRGPQVRQRRGRDRGRYRRRPLRQGDQPRRRPVRLGQLPGRQPLEQGRPPRHPVPDRRLPDDHRAQAQRRVKAASLRAEVIRVASPGPPLQGRLGSLIPDVKDDDPKSMRELFLVEGSHLRQRLDGSCSATCQRPMLAIPSIRSNPCEAARAASRKKWARNPIRVTSGPRFNRVGPTSVGPIMPFIKIRFVGPTEVGPTR